MLTQNMYHTWGDSNVAEFISNEQETDIDTQLYILVQM